ncbi:DEAD/DEAH box helicase [Propionivibrio dicarboxylicus]|uniref:DNA 3'-5' helicase II n=1 Tax=Propionivibrio dicarboxylicus TaxID=83767 RepID=A0A1G7Z2U0_9RHOO|nr:nuclease-related domain-containing DEAD/DEAH box helicase [Propionivibrio dicarboxylicus]SDH02917.1 UvrD/REP helicase N-terminal domain-containing protein [Propionivibrio dicarboxylicus]
MAIFLPALSSRSLRLTPGERRFGTCLMRKLEDDYHVWINVPVGPKQFRPDFVVLHPGRGILALEVKDWKLPTIQGMDRFSAQLLTDRGLTTVANPLEQARSYAISIKELLERDPLLVQQESGRYHGHLLLPWGFGAVLTNITRKQFEAAQLDQAIPGDRVICQDEMTETVEAEAIQQRLWGMFQYNFGRVLSLARVDRVRWHLFPEIRIEQGHLFDPATAEAPDPSQSIAKVLPDVVKIMDLEQEKVARNLGEGHRIIHGVAGSGKTLLLAYRCLHLNKQNLSKPILVLCFNKTLAAKLREMLTEKGAGDSVHVRHFHGWCRDMCTLYQLDLAKDNRPVYEKQVEAVITGAEKGRLPRAQYAAVLIDEGHDFEPEWFKLLVQMIDPETNSLLLLYDDAQNIYGKNKRRTTSWASLGIEAKGRSTILKVNYRNTVEALNFSYQFLSEYIDENSGTEEIPFIHPEFGGRNGQMPEIRRLQGAAQEVDHIAAWLKKRANDGIPFRDMAIIARFKTQLERLHLALAKMDIPIEPPDLASRADAIRLLTMHSSKGLEFNSVVIPDLGCMPYAKVPAHEEARLLYVALTRSTERLLVTYHSDSPFTQKIEHLKTQSKS